MFKNLEGQRIPDVTFRTREDHAWVDVSSDDIFKGNGPLRGGKGLKGYIPL